MDTPVCPRGETAQDLGGNLGETTQDRDRPSISAVDDFNARNAALNLLLTWLAKSTFLTELDAADTKARSVVAATPLAAGQVPPVQITSAPSYSPCSTTQFVGVPAFDVDHLGNVLLRSGYGGLDNLVEIEHLSVQDKADLSKLLIEDQDIQRELLVPRDTSVELSPSDFRNLVTGTPAQRELAALLRVYEPQGLARRVFGMSTLLKRMLDKHRVSLVSCTLGTSKTTLELGNSSDKARCARDFALLEKAFNQQVVEILEQAQSRLSESDRDFQRAAEEHNRQEQVLRDENAELQRQIEDYRLVNRQLEDRLRGGTFKVGRVMNFLNHHNTRTQINAADEFDADPGAYEYEVESADEESKVPETPKPSITLKPSSTKSTAAKIQRKLFSGSKPKDLTDFQLRPSTYTPSTTDTLDPTAAKQLSVTKARESLTQPVIWDKLRADIQELMRSHMSYDEALVAARADAEIHSHLDARHLVSMLMRIIYWKSLDKTPWVKYVPCWCYKEAESKLAKVLTSGEVPTRCLICAIQDDAVEIMAALYDSVTEDEDDEGRDATFSPGDDGQNKPQRRTTPPRQAKRGGDTTSDSSSKNKPKRASSPPKKRAKSGNGKKSRPGQERKQTALARKSYDSMSDSEKWIVEAPGRGILSWRHHGVLMKFPPGTANAVTQSFGFPDYAPNLTKDEDVQALRERWDSVAFKELMDTKP
ncbi:LOW QUALITY PROTEIN: hypothetical protein PHMEG_00017179 [Phytophthora megakarya]|uniref:Uncharacterized protein n=1 Tax=Phytophthora megakarya TaxID=4795 RepID=A0A225VZJ1_9STRA|nr:LOW QUALITY PROTEIN: hypothetical protein PHMEG_00017179 [Phytophthora megakarya]